jgi:hypothetical protein
VQLKPLAQTEQGNLPVGFIAVLLEHGFDGGGQLRGNAYGAMILQTRGDVFADCFTLAVFGCYGLAKELINGIKLVQCKGSISLIMAP